MIVELKEQSLRANTAERQPTQPVAVGLEEAELTVRVCLRRVFGSDRARCSVRAAQTRPVRWLAERVRNLFPVDVGARVVLVSAGYVLPPHEPLAILSPGDLVEVIPLYRDYGDENERKFYQKFTSGFVEDLDLELCPRVEKRCRDEPPVPLASGPDPHPAGELLHEMKRRALRLLDECGDRAPPCSSFTVEEVGAAGAPAEERSRRRRRVRRRRAPRSSDLTPTSVEFQAEDGAESAPAVRQNAGAAVRSPRFVRADIR